MIIVNLSFALIEKSHINKFTNNDSGTKHLQATLVDNYL